MKVFKFGGASVKDATGVKNVSRILGMFPENDKIAVVISAMGKTTNALEELANASFEHSQTFTQILENIKTFHLSICNDLFSDKNNSVYTELNNHFVELEWNNNNPGNYSYDKLYDQIVSMGEIISTVIVSQYLSYSGIKNKWMDARDLIRTNDKFREGKVDWTFTEKTISEKYNAVALNTGILITQGFIGSTSDNFTVTLGREGSDYTAAILAFCLNAESVTIWKDVPGVLNADPKWFDETKLIHHLSYYDATELSYYGATVIHPKTIKPLQNKNIPLYVKSFLNPNEPGTKIDNTDSPLPIPCFIFKVNQVLVSITPKDFSFIVEENLSQIFNVFHKHGIKINTMLNTAISFSVCADYNKSKFDALIEELQNDYKTLYNTGIELITIRYYDQTTIDRVTIDKTIMLEVKSRNTVQLVVKSKS